MKKASRLVQILAGICLAAGSANAEKSNYVKAYERGVMEQDARSQQVIGDNETAEKKGISLGWKIAGGVALGIVGLGALIIKYGDFTPTTPEMYDKFDQEEDNSNNDDDISDLRGEYGGGYFQGRGM